MQKQAKGLHLQYVNLLFLLKTNSIKYYLMYQIYIYILIHLSHVIFIHSLIIIIAINMSVPCIEISVFWSVISYLCYALITVQLKKPKQLILQQFPSF